MPFWLVTRETENSLHMIVATVAPIDIEHRTDFWQLLFVFLFPLFSLGKLALVQWLANTIRRYLLELLTGSKIYCAVIYFLIIQLIRWYTIYTRTSKIVRVWNIGTNWLIHVEQLVKLILSQKIHISASTCDGCILIYPERSFVVYGAVAEIEVADLDSSS